MGFGWLIEWGGKGFEMEDGGVGVGVLVDGGGGGEW